MRMARSTSPRRRYKRAEREVRLDGVRARIHQLQEHVERAVGLLGDEVIETGEIVGMELADAPGAVAPGQPPPVLAPAEVAGENADTSAERISNQASKGDRAWPGRLAGRPRRVQSRIG
jgi:hypothetical protein